MTTMNIDRIIAEQSEVIDIDSVQKFPQNPRVGNLPAIRESLRENGQFRPIIVQKSTGYIIGGNHTWEAAKAEGWTKIQACYLDVDDVAAKKIVLADNRTNDLSTYNMNALKEILNSLPDPSVGTGYDDEAVNDLLDGIQQRNEEAIREVLRPTSLPPLDMPAPQAQDDGEIGWEGDNAIRGRDDAGMIGDPDDMAEAEQAVEDAAEKLGSKGAFESAEEELHGAYGLKVDMYYEKVGGMDIPPLRPDMLVQPDEVPKNLIAWAGSATKDWPDEDQWWLYNVGIDSTSGMKDISKAIVSFYCWDSYFESWWDYPDRYTAKMLNSGIRKAVTPDFSQWVDDPKVLSLYNLYRNRWLGRYFQEAGIKVIPNISWRYGDKDYQQRYVLDTLPDRVPVMAMQLQTFDKDQTPEQLADLKAMIEHAGQHIQPDLTIFYVGKQALELLEDLNWPGEQLVIPNRLDALAKQAKKRQKKSTL